MTTTSLFHEEEGVPYGEKLIAYQFSGKDIFVISDLHIAAGLNSNGNYSGNENFFADQSLRRFIDHLIDINKNNPSLLIINGDLVDFLRISEIPETDSDFLQWNEVLNKIGIDKSISELKDSISKKERKYGFKTDDYKSVWRLYLCSRGHGAVFESLAKWLLNGHKLIIVKGNHDLEWYWKHVRDCMRLLLAEKISGINKLSVENVLVQMVFPNLTFIDDNFIINRNIYVEHGHRYEHFTCVSGAPVLANGTELNLPFGSFFNRYLINRIELAYPFIDDVRPRENILPVLIQERFPLAIKLLFCYVPFALLVIPKQQYKYALKYLFQFLLMVVLPLAIVVIVFWQLIPVKINLSSLPGIVQLLVNGLKSVGLLILSYFLSRLFAMLQLSPPAGLFKNAKAKFEEHKNVQVVIFGHTHDPEQLDPERSAANGPVKRYYNTGTWIPVFETDAADVRLDKTYTYLHLVQDSQNGIAETCLMRWNDDALRGDALPLMERK